MGERKQRNDVIRQVIPRDRSDGPDKLLDLLHQPLPTETINKIIEHKIDKMSRSQIAKKLGIPKLRVTHELMKLSVSTDKREIYKKHAPKKKKKGGGAA